MYHNLFLCLSGVRVWLSSGVDSLLQQVLLRIYLDSEWTATVHWLAHCGGSHGQLVW